MRAILTCSLLALLMHFSLAGEIGTTTQSTLPGPDVVVLKELSKTYQPVPFDHKSHAQMAEMWDGCTTCHHKTPSTQPVTEAIAIDHHDQSNADKTPACRSCHEITADNAELRMPSLKGAYHRQCMNCHREWANANSCNVCHQVIEGAVALATTEPATPDDIVGRMHPPIAEPIEVIYTTRFTPAVGAKAIFRHQEHSTTFGLKCVNCHRRDDCVDCHSSKPATTGPRPLNPGKTWAQTHGPCMGCHQKDKCRTCHFDEAEAPPIPFEHESTGQLLDKDHINLQCGQCHLVLKANKVITCGDVKCHKPELAVSYPEKRPGAVVVIAAPTSAPSTRPIVEAATQPETGVVIKRVRAAANARREPTTR